MSSEITNRAALSAMRNLAQATKELTLRQNRINTGLEVAGAKDNASVFAIAANLRADVAGWSVVADGLNRAQSAVDVALVGTETVSNLLIELKAHAVQLAGTASEALRGTIVSDMQALIRQIDQVARTNEFDGLNLLTGRPTLNTTTTTNYGLPSSTRPQPAFPTMASLPSGTFFTPSQATTNALPDAPLTPPSYDGALAAVSGIDAQTIPFNGGATPGRVSLLLDAQSVPDVAEIWQNGVRVAATGQPTATGGAAVPAGTGVSGPNVISFDYDPANGTNLELRFNEAFAPPGTAWSVGGLILQDPSDPPATVTPRTASGGSLQTTGGFDPPVASTNPEDVALARGDPPSNPAATYAVNPGPTAGRIDMVFDAFDRPDVVEVWQGGQRIAATGQAYAPGGNPVGAGVALAGQTTLSFDYDPADGPLEFRMNPGGADPDSAWVVAAISLADPASPLPAPSVSSSSSQNPGFSPRHIDFQTSPEGGTTRVSSRDLTATGLGLDILDFSNPQGVLDRLRDAMAATSEAAGYFGVKSSEMEHSNRFAGHVGDALQAGVGNLVDADMAKEAARLQAAQVRQQLAAQTVSVANSQPQWLLSLFRR
jgi:flagellin